MPAQYAQYKGSPIITNNAVTNNTATITGRNNLGTAVYLALYKSTSANGSYTKVGSTSSTVSNSYTGSVQVSGLTGNTTYYFKMAYYDPTGQVMASSLSNYMSVTTDPDPTT